MYLPWLLINSFPHSNLSLTLSVFTGWLLEKFIYYDKFFSSISIVIVLKVIIFRIFLLKVNKSVTKLYESFVL